MNEEEFVYDPEAEENTKKYRLPFALCQARGIEIQDWWTPRNAWEALKNGGFVDDVDEEYKEFYRNKKKQQAAGSRLRAERKKKQLADPDQNPIKNYQHRDNAIAGVEKGEAMTHEQADNGHVNPRYNKQGSIGYKTNCQTCVAAYVARRLGYDVSALPNLNNLNIASLSRNTSMAYIDNNTGKNPEKVAIPAGVKSAEWLNGQLKDGEFCSFEFEYVGRSSGHIIIAQKNDGKVSFYDPQTNGVYENLGHFGSISNRKIMKLSNCGMDEKFCDKIFTKSLNKQHTDTMKKYGKFVDDYEPKKAYRKQEGSASPEYSELSDEYLDIIYKKFDGGEDAMLDELNKHDWGIDSGDLDGILDSYLTKKTGKDSIERWKGRTDIKIKKLNK